MIAAAAGQAARALAIACAAAMLLTGPHLAEADDTPSLSVPHGLVWLVLPQARGTDPHPVVLILADRTGPDGREVPYVDYLLAAGIAVLQLGSDAPEEVAPLLAQPKLRAIARDIAPGLLDSSRIGILGFGGGGRAALAAPAEVPVAALYPACDGLSPASREAPTLLLHPDNREEGVACRFVIPQAETVGATTHGWDHGQGSWKGGTAMLPHPDGSRGRIFARGDGWATQESVARVVRHFRTAFDPAAPDSNGGPRRTALPGPDRLPHGRALRPRPHVYRYSTWR